MQRSSLGGSLVGNPGKLVLGNRQEEFEGVQVEVQKCADDQFIMIRKYLMGSRAACLVWSSDHKLEYAYDRRRRSLGERELR